MPKRVCNNVAKGDYKRDTLDFFLRPPKSPQTPHLAVFNGQPASNPQHPPLPDSSIKDYISKAVGLVEKEIQLIESQEKLMGLMLFVQVWMRYLRGSPLWNWRSLSLPLRKLFVYNR